MRREFSCTLVFKNFQGFSVENIMSTVSGRNYIFDCFWSKYNFDQKKRSKLDAQKKNEALPHFLSSSRFLHYLSFPTPIFSLFYSPNSSISYGIFINHQVSNSFMSLIIYICLSLLIIVIAVFFPPYIYDISMFP